MYSVERFGDLTAHRVQIPQHEFAMELGHVIHYLDPHSPVEAVDSGRLRRTMDAEDAVQLVAVLNQGETIPGWDHRFIGAATLSTLHGAQHEQAWLEDFVVVPHARGSKRVKDELDRGVADAMWDAMNYWRVENGLYRMRFSSAHDKEAAHKFYYRKGCVALAGAAGTPDDKTVFFVHNLDDETIARYS